MLNFLVLSDSHGRVKNIEEILSRQLKKPDAVFFLGDGLRDIMYCELGDIPVYSVSGNCDFSGFYGEYSSDIENIVEVGGYTVMMTHGHKYNVKSGYGEILCAAARRDIDILLFGHTHIPFEHIYTPESGELAGLCKPLYVMNPGAVGGFEPSWGCITVSDKGEILMSFGRL